MARTDDPFPRIRRFRSMGMPDEVIFGRLIIEGWADADIRHAFEGRTLALPEHTAPAAAAAHHEWNELPEEIAAVATRKRFSLMTIVPAIVVASIIGASFYVYLKPPPVYSISIPVKADTVSAALPELSFGALPALSDPEYYAEVKQKLVESKASFIDANLTSMQLQVFAEGDVKLTVPILAKGKPGSWWETPAGIYKIETKETNHFSTMGQVNMPYSLDFQGNFFIHGWPTEQDGTPVSSTYSGGCIRLATDDAQKVYELAAVGEPVVVYNQTPAAPPFSYSLKAPPSLSASEYLVADLDTGTVLAAKDSSVQAPIASITKLVSALVATEYINLDKQVTVPPEAIVYTSVPRLKAGQQFKAYDLLFLLLQESSNEAAETLASAVGRDQFVSDMNKKAQAIGLDHTAFADPSGAKDDMSTAADLFKLLRYIYDNRRFVFGITTADITDSAYGKPAFGYIADFNIIKNAAGATLLGGKVGETNQAGETYAGIFDMKLDDADRKVAVIVLGSQDSPADVARLLNFVHGTYAPAQ